MHMCVTQHRAGTENPLVVRNVTTDLLVYIQFSTARIKPSYNAGSFEFPAKERC